MFSLKQTKRKPEILFRNYGDVRPNVHSVNVYRRRR